MEEYYITIYSTHHLNAFIPAIQGLRGLAALSVLGVHLIDMPILADFLPPLSEWLQLSIFSMGHGVEVFLMISGFLIPASLARHGSVSKFLYERFLRIMPLFIALHAVVFTAGPLIGYKFFKDIDLDRYVLLFVVNLLFLPNVLGLPIGQQNAWTLSYEWAFYLWFAVFYLLGAMRGRTAALVAMVVSAAIVIWCFPIAAYFGAGMMARALSFHVDLRGPLGMICALVCIVVMYGTLQYANPLIGLLPGLILFAMTLTPTASFSVWLGGRGWQFLGKISYSLYLVHPFVLFPLQMAGAKLAANGVDRWFVWVLFVTIGAIASVCAAAVSYALIEERLTQWLDTQLRRAAKRVQAPLQGPQ